MDVCRVVSGPPKSNCCVAQPPIGLRQHSSFVDLITRAVICTSASVGDSLCRLRFIGLLHLNRRYRVTTDNTIGVASRGQALSRLARRNTVSEAGVAGRQARARRWTLRASRAIEQFRQRISKNLTNPVVFRRFEVLSNGRTRPRHTGRGLPETVGCGHQQEKADGPV